MAPEPTILDVAVDQARLGATIIETNRAVGRIETTLNTFLQIQYDMNKRLTSMEAKFDETLRDRVARVEEKIGPIVKIFYGMVILVLSTIAVALFALVLK